MAQIAVLRWIDIPKSQHKYNIKWIQLYINVYLLFKL